MAITAEQVTPVWPPASLAAFLLVGTNVWPPVFLGVLVADVTTCEPDGGWYRGA
jgi:integral membrane sensor domain MASE1